jgi:hypothetical protein
MVTRCAFARPGAQAIKTTPEEVSKRLTADIAKWHKVRRLTGIRPD